MGILCLLGQLYFYALFARIILSWFPIGADSPFATIFSFLYSITEPLLGPIRRMLPPMGVGGMALDLSPLIVIFAFQLLVIPLLCSLG